MKTPLQQILSHHQEGLGSRNNHPSKYVRRMLRYFECIKECKFDQIPPPICVQTQISSRCSTFCEMCHHWKEAKKEEKQELSLEEWQCVFEDISKFGVSTVIFSGGEPLMREDLVDLLKSAIDKKLKIGLLTNGTMPSDDFEERQDVITAIKECVEWVAISIDGTENEDDLIRHPVVRERIYRLKEFCKGLFGGPKLSATVTLQKGNINIRIKDVCEFIKELGIPRVNFKLATGDKRTLQLTPKYLLSREELRRFEEFLWNNRISDDKGNNLDYLRRCFASDLFNVEDAAEGSPLRSFYANISLRCFTPFIFSLIHTNGEVYPCCHIYRDNHGYDSISEQFRIDHSMGNVRITSFSKIWNGKEYSGERRNLERINPNKLNFFPCGECTRYCQHNLVLTEIYKEYENNLEKFKKEIEAEGAVADEPVWF